MGNKGYERGNDSSACDREVPGIGMGCRQRQARNATNANDAGGSIRLYSCISRVNCAGVQLGRRGWPKGSRLQRSDAQTAHIIEGEWLIG